MLRLSRDWVVGVALAVPLLLAVPAQAQNILLNPTFLGAQHEAPPWVFTSAALGSDFNYGEGSGATFGGIDSSFDDTISQTVSTAAGQTYNLTFYLFVDGSPQNFFVSWDGSVIPGAAEQDGYNAGEFSFNVVATGTDTLSFAGNNPPSYTVLDDTSLVEGAGTSVPFAPGVFGIPEIDPASAAAPMIALSVGLLLLADLRRKSS